MEAQGQPFDYLLFANLTSGTTNASSSKSQKDYILTLELVNIQTGIPDKEQATIRKGYSR
jgi:PBP1b-binding outer membrane lipoprotein LpoB